MGATIYIYIFPFSLFVTAYIYASVCDFVCLFGFFLVQFLVLLSLVEFFFGLVTLFFLACFYFLLFYFITLNFFIFKNYFLF